MTTSLDVGSSTIRLVQRLDGRIVGCDEWPVPGGDPLTALANLPLPKGLGPVRVALAHDDLLLKIMRQPEGPPERIDRMVRFEAASLSEEASSIAWMRLPGDGEVRCLVQITRQRLIERVRAALAPHGATLAGLSHPSLALGRLWRHQGDQDQPEGTVALVDVGGQHLHVTILRNHEMVLLRSQQPGMDALVEEIAQARSQSATDARNLIRHLTAQSPEDLLAIVARQAAQVSAAITATARFARTQLDLTDLEPSRIIVAGAGAQVHGFLPALAARAGVPVSALNPFSGQSLGLTLEEADRLAGLPSPWAVALGMSLPAELELDALTDARRERRAFWRGPGALAAASVAAAVFACGGAAIAELGAQAAEAERAQAEGGLPQARDLASRLERARTTQAVAAARMRWLDAQRRVTRIAPEFLGAIGELQDPNLCPVVLKNATFSRLPAGGTSIEINGVASAGTKGTAAALHTFEAGLKRVYPVIASLEALSTAISRDQPFRYLITIPDPTP